MGRGLDLGFFTLRYYSLLFAGGFVLGYFIMKRIFAKEGIHQDKLDSLVTYVVVATVVGARLGHVFFYQWDYYSQHPVEIFKVWEGGLASHGAAIAIILAIIIYCRKVLKKPVLWMLDRLVITIALAGCLIRLGNYMNSEIYGEVANSELQTVFTNPVRERILANYGEYIQSIEFERSDDERVEADIIYPVYKVSMQVNSNLTEGQALNLLSNRVEPMLKAQDKEDQNLFIDASTMQFEAGNPSLATVEAIGVPRRPTQLYEAFGYLMIFFILFRVFQNRTLAEKQGLIFGLFLILIFGFRFFIEYLKENQVSAEEGGVLNIGQKLSIPLVLAGLFFVIRAKKPGNE